MYCTDISIFPSYSFCLHQVFQLLDLITNRHVHVSVFIYLNDFPSSKFNYLNVATYVVPFFSSSLQRPRIRDTNSETRFIICLGLGPSAAEPIGVLIVIAEYLKCPYTRGRKKPLPIATPSHCCYPFSDRKLGDPNMINRSSFTMHGLI